MIDDMRAVTELAAHSDANKPHAIVHYIYMPTVELAASVATELSQRGFRTEGPLGADGGSWLVLACEEAIPTDAHFAATRILMERLAGNGGGEYDG